VQEVEDTLIDLDNQIKSMNYEKLSYKLELKLEINDAELQEIETKIKTLENDFYSMAEVAQLWFNGDDGGDKYSNITDTYASLEQHARDLNQAYEDGKIS
jgi:hypothetical protein